LLGNVYGWFVRVERGIYTLSDAGKAAIVKWKSHLPDRYTRYRFSSPLKNLEIDALLATGIEGFRRCV
jgi:DNA-binding PadR family transcriptional regulator